MTEVFKVLSINHKLAPVEIREQFTMTPNECSDFLCLLRDTLGLSEGLVVSTCNRTEIYINHDDTTNTEVYKLLCATKAIKSSGGLEEYFVFHEGTDAINHLYNVAIGLDSQVLGDIQIFGQVKQSYQLATDLEMAGPFLHRLMHSIFNVHKKVSQQTKFKTGAASISYNAVKLLSSNTILSKDVKILISGTGSIGTATAKNLLKCGYTNVTLTNRTIAKAQEIGKVCGFDVIEFEYHKSHLQNYDVLVSSVGSADFYSAKDLKIAGLVAAIDLSAPRSITNDGDGSNLRLFDIDDVGNMRDDTLSVRTSEVVKVTDLIQSGMMEFVAWSEEMNATGSIKTFKNSLENIRKECIKANLKRMSSKELQMVELVTSQFINKIVQKPIIKLKQECKRNNADQLSEVLIELFDLNQESLKES